MFGKFQTKSMLVMLLALLAALAVPSLAFAGGWAVVTLDKLPQEVPVGETYSVGMMVRQHGQTPWEVEALQVETKHVESGQKLSFSAVQEGRPGHYQVDLLFPQAGRWEWSVATGLFPMAQPMPALMVADGASPAVAARNERPDGILQNITLPSALLGIVALAVLGAGIVLVVRSHNTRLRALSGIASFALCGVLAFAFFSFTNAQAERQKSLIPKTAEEQNVGQQLFLAKGCIVCHANERAIAVSESYGVNFGPNLTSYSNEESYLRQFLANPSAVKANTDMPNLKLSTEEIDELVRFINDGD